MQKNVGSQKVSVQMVSATDGSAFTGSVTVVISGDGAAQGSSGGTGPAHLGNGEHVYTPTTAETNYDHIAFTFTGSGAVPTTVQVYTGFPQTGDSYAAVGTDGSGLTEAGGDGDHLTAIDLPNQTMDITGNLSGSVGSVTGAVGSVTGAVGSVTGNVGGVAGTIQTLDALDTAQDTQHGLTRTDIGNLNDITVANILAGTITEISSVPGASPTLLQALSLLYMALRNKLDVDATTKEIHKDDGTVLGTKALTDAASVYSEGKMA